MEACMKKGNSERERKGVYGLGSLWRIVWCMVIGVIGAVKVLLCVIVGKKTAQNTCIYGGYLFFFEDDFKPAQFGKALFLSRI